MNYTPNKILVTGGAGFIGANFIKYLLNQHDMTAITNIDNLTYAGQMANIAEFADDTRHQFIKEDICNQDQIETILRDHEIDTVVHFAAETHVDRSITDPAAFINANIIGTFRLLESVKKVWLTEKKLTGSSCRFHHISTDEVFGSLKPAEHPFRETNQYSPNSPYSASKASSDHLVNAYHHTYGLPVTTSNCSNNYGPLQHSEKLIPTIINCCLTGKSIPIYGNGTNIRDWLYVTDHCHAIDLIIRQGQIGETYNIGGNEEHNNLEIAKTVCETLAELQNQDPQPLLDLITLVEDRPGHDWRYAIDSCKMQQELDWKPEHDFEQGIRETVKWYFQNRL